MVINESAVNRNHLEVGDLVEVVTSDNRKFKSIVVMNLGEGFVGKVLSKDSNVGTASWKRYGLRGDSRFQSINECAEIKVLEKAQKRSATGSLSLNESVTKSNMIYYETPIGDDKYAIFCLCEGYGGWSFGKKVTSTDHSNMLKESFLNSQISKLRYNGSVN